MKEVIDVINEEQQINESSLFSMFDVTFISLISSSIATLISIGCGVSSQMVRALIAEKNRNKFGKEKVELLQELKNFVRDLDFDVSDIPQAESVLNNTGEWTTEMLSELRNGLYSKMDDDQKKKYDELETKYIKIRNKFARL